MTSMPDKGITGISYNFLNLPEEIEQTNVSSFYYRADGVKLRKKLVIHNEAGSNTVNTEYLSGFVYTTARIEAIERALNAQDAETVALKHARQEETFVEPANGVADPGGPGETTLVLSYFPTAEGYYDYLNNKYIYQYKDHLGNVRLSYARSSDTNAVEILDINDYYPFGMNMQGVNSAFDTVGAVSNYKYNQKELQETGFYDYGWRQYMPDLGRWFGMDKLSETYNSKSPYAYVMNNPAMMYDPNGRVSIDWINSFWNNSQNGVNTTWTNTGSGFSNNWGGNMDYDASPTNFSFGGTSTGIGSSYSGNYVGTINLPPVYLTGKSSGWGSQIQSQVNSYMNSWNEQNWGNAVHGGLYGLGHGLNYVGGNIIATRGKFGGATPGTSIASEYFRSTSWANNKVPKPYQKLFFNKNFQRQTTTKWGAWAGRATPALGHSIVAISVGVSVYNVATADNKALAASQEVGGWAGAYVGAQMGAELGATIGSLFPGPGTLIGGVVGGVIGGAVGYGYGSDFGESIYYDF